MEQLIRLNEQALELARQAHIRGQYEESEYWEDKSFGLQQRIFHLRQHGLV